MLKTILSLACNLAIVIWTAASVVHSAKRVDEATGQITAARTFRYFTTDSNLLAAAASLLLILLEARSLLSGQFALPAWALLVKLVGTAAVSVTLLTVLVFLGPSAGYGLMFAEEGLYLHLLGPLLAIVSFCFFEKGGSIGFGPSLLGLLPTAVYGVLYLIMVVFVGKQRGGWEDFYGFNKGGKWPVSFVFMHIGTFGICMLLRLLHNL